MISYAIKKLIEQVNLTEDEMISAMNCIMEGEATPAQIGSFVTALRIKGETIDEITGCAKVMRDKAEKIAPKLNYYIDTCGTGGDGANTFNISTASAFVASAGGVPVAKHGNRSVSSKSGSADVLEALGVKISLQPQQVKECIENVGIGFLFAPSFHKSMKYAAGPRKELGVRTIFNILGPLTNPAGAQGQLMGVFSPELTEPLANVLLKLGVERALVVHGMDGMDEFTTACVTKVSEVKGGKVLNYELAPEELGVKRAGREEITGGDAAANSDIIRSVFNGEKGPKRDIVVLNAAAALYVGKVSASLKEGILLAEKLIDEGVAARQLDRLIEYSHSVVEI